MMIGYNQVIGAIPPEVPDPSFDGEWLEVSEIKAQKLVEKHGGSQGDAMLPIAHWGPPYPNPPAAWHWQVFEAPDGFRILMVNTEEGLEYFYIIKGSDGGLKWWHLAIAGGLGAGAGYALAPRPLGKSGGALVGGGATMLATALTAQLFKKFGEAL